MSKAKHKAVGVLDYFETEDLSAALAVHALAGGSLKKRVELERPIEAKRTRKPRAKKPAVFDAVGDPVV